MKNLCSGKTKLLMAFYFMSLILLTIKLSAQGPCDFIKFTLENYQPCCFRLHVDNSIECYPELRLLIDAGTYESFQASVSSGWTCTKISPTELLLKHSSGKVPIGISIPVTFCLEPGFDPLLSILWDNTCALLGCFLDIPLKGCTLAADACILGVKYRECDKATYSNQTTIPNFTIRLFDESGTLLNSTVTDSSGEYSFCNLPPGNYVVSEVVDPGWTSKLPASGKYNVTLLPSEILTRNFGNCPGCSCDSIYVDLVEDTGESDTCSFTLIIQNTGGYCFQGIKMAKTVKGSKSNSDNRILEPGWTLIQLDSQNLILNPPDDYIPVGLHYSLTVKTWGDPHETTYDFTITTSYNNGGNAVDCKKTFSFICPKLSPPSCCPSGTTQGPELVKNGDFEKAGGGPVDFIPCYVWFNPGSPGSPGKYSVLQSNQVFSANAQWACTDHTNGSPTGKMLIIDGQNTNCNFVWQETVTVNPGVQYAFCAYVNNLVLPSKNLTDPIVELRVNNTLMQTITLPESPDQWQSISGLWQSGINTTALLEVRLVSIIGSGNDFAVDDISFRSCSKDSCICGSYEFFYGIGRGPLLPKNCGDLLTVPSSGAILPIRFLSSFKCLGINCPQTTVDWILTGPAPFIPISMSNVSAIPDFIVPITNATFAYPGLYTLTVTGYCNGKPCPPCILYFDAEGHDCCNNQTDFELGITNAVTITVDNNKCKATLNIGNLPKCDSIGPIFWGDGTSSKGPFISGTMPMHTYAGTGSYYITWTATEYVDSVMPLVKCFDKVFRDSIQLVCDTCKCKSFSSLSFFNPFWSGFNVVASCDDTTFVQLPCDNTGWGYIGFQGRLNCNAINCLRDSIHWKAYELFTGQPIATGTASHHFLNPNSGAEFEFQLNTGLFKAGVPYRLELYGQCGSDNCYCQINFSIAACLCSCDLVAQDVSQGFYISGNKLSCNRTIKPVALCPNDHVSWVVTPSITPAPGNSIGSISQVLHFTNPGIYTVCMFVTRIDPLKQDTCRDSYCRKVTVNCFPNPTLRLCETNAINNGDFTEGRVEGHIGKNYRGKIDSWSLFPNTGDDLVFVSDSSGASDDGQVILVGNKNNFAGIWQQVDLIADNFINIGFDYIDYRKNSNLNHLLAADIVFRLQNDSTLNSSSSTEILRKGMKDKRDDKERSYQSFDTSIIYQVNPDLKYLVICLQNKSDSVFSVIGIDNIEMCTSKIPLSTHSEKFGQLRIYPNPSNGNFTIEMQQPASSGMVFRIIDLTGRSILEKEIIPGNQIQNVDASRLSSGFYFLQVISKGKVFAVEKLIKQ